MEERSGVHRHRTEAVAASVTAISVSTAKLTSKTERNGQFSDPGKTDPGRQFSRSVSCQLRLSVLGSVLSLLRLSVMVCTFLTR